MRNLTPLIEKILAVSTKSRDSDHELIIQVLLARGFNPTMHQINLLREVNFESIRRTRQKLQQNGKYPSSPGVARQRKLKSYVIQQNAPIAKPERIEKLINEQLNILPWGKG